MWCMDHYGYTLGRLLTAWNVLVYITWSEMHAIAMKWDELARTCDDLPWISRQYVTVRRVAARSAHNQRVLWSWHLVCSGPALPQRIGRWRLTATKWPFILDLPARDAKPALFSPLPWECFIIYNTKVKVIGTRLVQVTRHSNSDPYSSSGYARVWAQQNSWWLKSPPGTYI